MLFDIERARSLSQEYEQRVSDASVQQALRAAQGDSAIMDLVDRGLYLIDALVRIIGQQGQIIVNSMRWLLITHNK